MSQRAQAPWIAADPEPEALVACDTSHLAR